MYVCLCRGVSDRKVRKAINRGATTVEEISRTCGAGSGCGGCRPELQAMLHEVCGGCEAALPAVSVVARQHVLSA
jgi:bacterioferritin-associated ferredoxin